MSRTSVSGPEKKKATVASGPKFREETPKKGYDTATPSPYRTAILTSRRTICNRKIHEKLCLSCMPARM